MKTLKYIISFLALTVLVVVAACSDDLENVLPPPTPEDAAFTFTFDEENPNKVHFLAEPKVETWYTHWSFGDNSSAEGLETSKVFLKKGDYDVQFKIFTESGSAASVQTVVINEDFEGPNILLNGEFNSDEHWTILPISDGVEVGFNGENATWTGGGWGQVGIYQPVHIEANVPYQIDMEVSGNGMSDSWFEVYLGMATPIPGQDYADGGMRLALNTWNGCGGEPFDGLFTEISCGGEGNGLITVETTGTYYLVIRGGGSSYGDGVTIDNASIRPLESGIVITPPSIAPEAKFTAESDNLEVSFTNNSLNAVSYEWNFGDGSDVSTEEHPVHTYEAAGTYTVSLTATNDQGSDEATQEITVQEIVITDYIQNATFDDTSIWTIIQQNGANNGKVTIADGVATFDEVNDIPSGNWGQEAHMAMYQAVNMAPGNYQFDMDIITNGIDEVWFEVYVGNTKPIEGTEYNFDNSGATKILAFNAWDCGDTNKTYTGKMAAVSCQDTDGTITIDTQDTYYFVIRTGGFTFGEGGIVIDNITMETAVVSEEPTAGFTADTNELTANFTNTSENATSYAWDFGDGTGTSTEENPSYTYTQNGTYTVKLVATNDVGSNEFTSEVTVEQTVTVQDYIQNATFDDTSVWKFIQQNGANNGKVTIENGVAVFDEVNDAPSGSWGQEAHVAMYQAVNIAAGDYQFDMDITTNGIDEVWFEVYLGTTVPQEGVEYNFDNNNAQMILAFNAWDCGDTNKTYSGKMAAASCKDTDGTISLEADTYYFVIRTGGFTFGDGGIVIDNITMDPTVIVNEPTANFSFQTTDLQATFTNTSEDATSYSWDFGDGSGTSTEENPIYTYATAGTYTVTLIATNNDGSNEITKQVTVSDAPVVNLISNGTFEDATGWTIINQYETANTNGSVTIADGVAKFEETTDADWKHMAIYTAVELTAGTYQFDMDMTYENISDIWGEVYIGAEQPQEGTETQGIEYSGDQKVLKAYNAWDCGDIKTYSGKASESGCDDANPDNPGQFEITADGTYYLLFRTGGKTYGTSGITVDNWTLTKIN